jgi:hypothetical protein
VDREPYYVEGTIVAMGDDPYHFWIIRSFTKPRMVYMTKDEPMFFTNLTDPDGDAVMVGHRIRITQTLLDVL